MTSWTLRPSWRTPLGRPWIRGAAAGLFGLRQRSTLSDRRWAVDDGGQRHAGEGLRLVRQRVGLRPAPQDVRDRGLVPVRLQAEARRRPPSAGGGERADVSAPLQTNVAIAPPIRISGSREGRSPMRLHEAEAGEDLARIGKVHGDLTDRHRAPPVPRIALPPTSIVTLAVLSRLAISAATLRARSRLDRDSDAGRRRTAKCHCLLRDRLPIRLGWLADGRALAGIHPSLDDGVPAIVRIQREIGCVRARRRQRRQFDPVVTGHNLERAQECLEECREMCLIQDEKRIHPEEPGVERAHCAAHAVARKEEPGADHVDGTDDDGRMPRVGEPFPVVGKVAA